MSNIEERDLFEQNDIIDQYCIEGSLEIKSKNHIYKAFIPNKNKDYYCIKAYPYDSQKNIDNFTREQSIVDKFAGQPFILPIIKSIPYSTQSEEVNDEGKLEEKELKYICNVTKFCDNLDLRDVYNQEIKTLPYETGMRMKKIIFYQSLKILECLHENKVVHHDIKLPNFLVKTFNPPETLELFLIDFELANDLAEVSHIKRFCGTVHYIAPEIYLKKKHDFSVDIWSLGIMIYFIYNDKYPFTIRNKDNAQSIFKKILNHSVEFETRLPGELEELILSMLQKNPGCRITASEALNSSFFDDVKNLAPPIVSETKQIVAQSAVNMETNSADQIERIPSDGQFYTEI